MQPLAMATFRSNALPFRQANIYVVEWKKTKMVWRKEEEEKSLNKQQIAKLAIS